MSALHRSAEARADIGAEGSVPVSMAEEEDLFEDFLASLPRVHAAPSPQRRAIAGPALVAQAAHPVLRRVDAGLRLDRRLGAAIVRPCRPRSSLSARQSP